MSRKRCNARLTAGWLSNRRAAARVTLRSSARTVKTINRLRSAWRKCVVRITYINIMHWNYLLASCILLLVGRGTRKKATWTQGERHEKGCDCHRRLWWNRRLDRKTTG